MNMLKLYLLKIAAIVLVLAGCYACKEDIVPQDAIQGKWIIEAAGATENDMRIYGTDGGYNDYWVFLPDETIWHYCGTCVGEKYFQMATYKFDSKYFYWYLWHQRDKIGSDTPSETYYYHFYGDRLKITTINPRTPSELDILITNITIYKRLK